MSAPSASYWRFAPTNGGAEQTNNPGQVTFADEAVTKAVRELLQNSVDHPQPGLDGVTVNFTLLDLPATHFNAAQLAEHARQARQLLAGEGDQENAARYQRAVEALVKPTIKTLAVTDTGTTGLVGENWRNLVFREGKPTSDIAAAHGGSYGFGKNAAFNLSLANTVVYSTRYVERAAQGRVTRMAGRAQLISHPDPKTSESLQAIGFFSHHQDGAYNQPLAGPEIPDDLLLSETGAGVFIIAFNTDYANWPDQVAGTVAADFFAAVHDRKLSVAIRTTPDAVPRIIDRDTLEIELDRLPANHPSRYYYRAYREGSRDTTQPTGQLGCMGSLQLHTLADPKAPRRLVHINRRGMLITEARLPKENPFYPTGGGSWSPWCAVTMAADDPTDAFIRRTEPPAHNAVQYGILRDPNESEHYRAEYKHHRDQISAIIRDRIEETLADSGQNIRELAQLFPDLPDENSGAVRLRSKKVRRSDTGPIPGAAIADDGDDVNVITDQPTKPRSPRKPHQGGTRTPSEPQDDTGGGVASDKPTIPYARAMQTAPDIVTVRIQLPDDIDEKGVAFIIRQTGEERRKGEESELAIQSSTAYGTLAAQAHTKGNAIHVTGEPGAEMSVKLTLHNPADAKAGFRTEQVFDE